MQTQLAAVLNLPQHKLRVVCRSVSTETPQLFPRYTDGRAGGSVGRSAASWG